MAQLFTNSEKTGLLSYGGESKGGKNSVQTQGHVACVTKVILPAPAGLS